MKAALFIAPTLAVFLGMSDSPLCWLASGFLFALTGMIASQVVQERDRREIKVDDR